MCVCVTIDRLLRGKAGRTRYTALSNSLSNIHGRAAKPESTCYYGIHTPGVISAVVYKNTICAYLHIGIVPEYCAIKFWYRLTHITQDGWSHPSKLKTWNLFRAAPLIRRSFNPRLSPQLCIQRCDTCQTCRLSVTANTRRPFSFTASDDLWLSRHEIFRKALSR